MKPKNYSKLLKFVLFANDTNVFFSSNNPNNLQNVINSELEKVSVWLATNQLSVNVKKTNFIIFKPRQKTSVYDSFKVGINFESVLRVKNTKFLGVIIDKNLSCKNHISTVAGIYKISRSIGIISKSRASLFHKNLFLCSTIR